MRALNAHRSPILFAGATLLAASLPLLTAGCSSKSSGGNPACVGMMNPPTLLECTGLYSNIATHEVAAAATAYAPAVPLWADNATKQRWISIPAGQTIDRTDPNEWTFPVGTKVWKEFSYNGTRVETRYFEKETPTYWVYTTYQWSADETSATQNFGGDIPFPGDFANTYHIPTPDECDKCHRGRTDRLLGFEEVSLGLSGATGLTLAQLASQNLLSPPPPSTSLTVGDDGTGLAAPPLSWLHINCGTTCHNRNQNATGYGAGMYLRLDPTLLDGRSSANFDSLVTTVGVPAQSSAFMGVDRIIPGDSTDSILPTLIALRGPSDQMPPIATRIVDATNNALVDAWIDKMPNAHPPMDGGIKDAAEDAKDARPHDAHDDAKKEKDAEADAHPMDATLDAHEADAGPDAHDATVDSQEVDSTADARDAEEESAEPRDAGLTDSGETTD